MFFTNPFLFNRALRLTLGARPLVLLRGVSGIAKGRMILALTRAAALGQSPVVLKHGRRLAAAVGAMVITPRSVILIQRWLLPAVSRSMALSPQAVVLQVTKPINAIVRTMALTPVAAILRKSLLPLAAVTRAVAIVPNPIGMLAGSRVAAGHVAISITRNAALILRGRVIQAVTDVMSITPRATALKQGHLILTELAFLTLAPRSILLQVTKPINALARAMTLTAQSALLKKVWLALSGTTQTMGLTPRSASIFVSLRIAAVVDAMTITRNAAQLLRSRLMTTITRDQVMTPRSSQLLTSRLLQGPAKAMTIAAHAAGMMYGRRLTTIVRDMTITPQIAILGELSLEVLAHFNALTFTGNGAARSLVNDIDLSANDGVVWIKRTNSTGDHYLFSKARGVGKYTKPSSNAAETTAATSLTAFNSDGFSLGTDANINTNSAAYVAWALRKAARYFEPLIWTGNGLSTGRLIPHSLGVQPGAMLVARHLNGPGLVGIWHKDTTPGTMMDHLTTAVPFTSNVPLALGNGTIYVAPSSTDITAGPQFNINGNIYSAFLFGPGGLDTDMIKCGVATGGVPVDLDWAPQWLYFKRISAVGDHTYYDSARGIGSKLIHTTAAAAANAADTFNADGFTIAAAGTYVYIAIRAP